MHIDFLSHGEDSSQMVEEQSIQKQWSTTIISLMNSSLTDTPQALDDDYEGWVNPQIVQDFTTYADVCFREFGDRVLYWTTINEPNIEIIPGYDFGISPPERCSKPFGTCTRGNSSTEPYIVAHNYLLAHASVFRLYKQKYQRKQQGYVGLNLFATKFVPETNSIEDILATERAREFVLGCG